MHRTKVYGLTLVSILLFSLLPLSLMLSFTLLSLVPPVYASTGHPLLGAVNNVATTPTAVQIASFNVSITAGSIWNVTYIDGATPTLPAYFAIFFYIGSWNVTFSGAQFDLYMSKDGYSAISTDDKLYAGSFYVADLDATYPKKVTITNALLSGGKADFYLGTFIVGDTTYKALVGPIPFDISSDYKYIKIFDGTTTSVAVTTQFVQILPALILIPPAGPGGATVTLMGVALLSNQLVNISYILPTPPAPTLITQLTTDAVGKFTHTWVIADLKMVFTGLNAPIPSDPIDIQVKYNATGAVVGTVRYYEYERAFIQFRSLNPFVDYTAAAGYGWGNDTMTISVYVFGSLIVAGNYWNPTDNVTFVAAGISMSPGFATPNATGFFNVTLTVPELSIGAKTVEVKNAGVRYIFTINVLPTLVLVPHKGPVATSVQCLAYGFNPNIAVYIYWYEKALGDGTYYNMVNGTTGSDGKFNLTVTFIVPHAYGGGHDVNATGRFQGATNKTTLEEVIAKAVFTITPLLWIEPSRFKNQDLLVHAIGTGFDPRIGYAPNIDNTMLAVTPLNTTWPENVYANKTGDLDIAFVAAGFRPGLHVFSLYPALTYVPVYATFSVTTEGDPIIDFLKSMNATIVDIKDEVATIETAVGTIKVDIAAIKPVITKIDGNVATIMTDVGLIKADVAAIKPVVTTIDGNVATVKTDVGTIKGTVTKIDGTTATIKTDVGDLKASLPPAVSGLTTVVYVILILALIAAIAAIYAVVIIHRKIAA